MAGINRRDLIKGAAVGGAALSLGNAVLGSPSTALAGEQPDSDGSPVDERKPEVIASCHCKKVVLRLVNLDPKFTVCHCDTCQMVHNGPWYGANCSDIKVLDGEEYVSQFPLQHGRADVAPAGAEALHFCSNCGSRLYYSLGNDTSSNGKDPYNASLGLIRLIFPTDMQMENEVFFDMKPDYYGFHETKKFSSG